METEIWKDVVGYEGLYQISNLGRVKSLGNNATRKEKILKNRLRCGYFNVMLYKNKESKMKLVHRMVAIAFVLNPENKPQINHINGIRNFNIPENLEWTTQSENMLHAYRIGLQKWHGKPQAHGEQSGRSKVKESDILEIRRLHTTGLNYNKLAKLYNMSNRQISFIVNKKSWKHI